MKRRRRRFRVREKMLPIWDTVSVTTEFQSSESQSEKSFATTDLCAVLKAAEAVQVALAATVPEMIWNFNGTLIFCRMFSFEIPVKR